ncbi:MAG: periplasmic heavy metal sensor [Candidatus Melainabacteria bacterium]|nr:periplasmic heavy metal sensor [Candidatus Melainabacteria bacterium]
MQSNSKKRKLSLHKLLALAFCLALGVSQQVFAQPVEDPSGAFDGGGEPQSNMRGGQRWRQKMMNMPPEKRELFMQRLRERRQGQEFPAQQFMQEMPRGQGAQGPQDMPGQGNPNGPGAPGGPGMGNFQNREQFANQRGGMRKRPGGGGRQGFGFGGRALDLSQLNLTEKQKSDILAMRAKHSEQAKSIQKNLRGKRMELRNMLFSPDLNRKALQEKRNELRGLQNQIDDIMIDDFLGVRSVLNEDQIKRLAETNLPNQKRKTSAEIQPKSE